MFDYMDNVRALELKIEDERRDAERAGEQRAVRRAARRVVQKSMKLR